VHSDECGISHQQNPGFPNHIKLVKKNQVPAINMLRDLGIDQQAQGRLDATFALNYIALNTAAGSSQTYAIDALGEVAVQNEDALKTLKHLAMNCTSAGDPEALNVLEHMATSSKGSEEVTKSAIQVRNQDSILKQCHMIIIIIIITIGIIIDSSS
jgi:hypothetical protein